MRSQLFVTNTFCKVDINGTEIINTRHELLDVDAYIHITSPIRRYADVLVHRYQIDKKSLYSLIAKKLIPNTVW